MRQENFRISEKDKLFMQEALKEAEKAFSKGEVPVGAVLVLEETVIAREHNQVELCQDATEHAEMRCLRAGARERRNWRLLNTTLYCTLEPCSMCAGALFSCRVQRVVWAAPDLRVGANGSWVDVFGAAHPLHQIEIVGGVLEEEAALLLRKFFQKQRSAPKRPLDSKNI